MSSDPSAVPTAMAMMAEVTLRPYAVALKPSSTTGKLSPAANHTKNCERGLPCRSWSGMWSTPKGSTLRSEVPYWAVACSTGGVAWRLGWDIDVLRKVRTGDPG